MAPGLGVLQPHFLEHVPGTALLIDEDGPSGDANVSHQLKHGTGKNAHIVLVPQPTDSPNDPLNWPTWKRESCFFTLCGMTALAGALGPILSAATADLTVAFDTTFEKITLLTGYQMLGEAAIGLFIAAIGSKYGKRPIFLFSATMVFIGSIWSSASQSYDSFNGSRLLQGFGIAAYEVVVPASIGDLYCTHQRGHRIAIWTIALMGGTYFCPIIAGVVENRLGWRYMFIITACLMFPFWLMTIFFVPEHAFRRAQIYNTDTSSTDDLVVLSKVEHKQEDLVQNASYSEHVVTGAQDKPRTFLQSLSPYSGTYSDVNILKLFVRPIPLMIYPAAIYLYLLQGTVMVWTIGISVILAILFEGPPYQFGAETLGFIYVGPLIAVFLAYLCTGYTSDKVAKFMARRNRNVYEPEFRLLLAVPALVFGAAGFFSMGNAIELGASWVVCVFCWSLANFGTIICLNVTNSYLIDGHRDLRNELFISCLLFKNFFAFGESYFFNDFLDAFGPAKMFDIIGGIHCGICLLTIPMYIFGKYCRAFMHKHDVLRFLRLD